MNAKQARKITKKAADPNQQLVPILACVYEVIHEAASRGHDTVYNPFGYYKPKPGQTPPTAALESAACIVLRAEGHTVNLFKCGPQDEGSYYIVSW